MGVPYHPTTENTYMDRTTYSVRIPFGLDDMVFDYAKVAFGRSYFDLTVDEQRIAVSRVRELCDRPYSWTKRTLMRTLTDYSVSELRGELLKREVRVDAEPEVIRGLREYKGYLTEGVEHPTYGVSSSDILEAYDTLAEAYERLRSDK